MRSQTELMRLSLEKLYDERIAQADIWIRGLENELIKNEKNLSDTIRNLNESFYLQISNITNLANASLHEGDKILGITSNFEYSNDGWQDYLWTRNGSSRVDAENAWGKLYGTLWELKAIKEKKIIISADTLNEYTTKLEVSYDILRMYHEKMVFMLENSVVGAWLVYDTRDKWTQSFNTFKSNTSEIEWAFISWKNNTTSISTLSWSKSTEEISLDSLRIQVQNAQKNKEILLAEKKTKIRELGVNITELQSKKWEIGTKIAETKMNTFLAQDSLESNIIRAPYDGIILEKYMNVGTIIWSWIPLLRITSEDKSMLKTYIDNTLYDYKVWDTLEIMSPIHNTIITGSISLLQKQRDPIHNKNSIEIILSHSENVIGERMIIQFSRKKSPSSNGTIIPVNALITRYWPAGVYIIDSGVVRFQLIEVIASDLIFAEVLWLIDGMTIITQWKENIYDWQILTRKETLSAE